MQDDFQAHPPLKDSTQLENEHIKEENGLGASIEPTGPSVDLATTVFDGGVPLTTTDAELGSDPGLLTDTMGTATEIISWLFSDAMLANVRDPLLSPTYYTFDSPMALQNLLTPPASFEELSISEGKRHKMLEMMPTLRSDMEALNISEDALFQQKFLSTFWTRFHPQFPILHRPTFNPDKCPSGLLWCIILVGAALMKEDVLARSIAEPLRWCIFGSPDFNPPAKLWVIQALLILELYEKAMGDRQMHVRAHIHHGTTLQLIRRGTILTGGSNDSMFQRSKSDDGGEYLAADSSDPWKRWIQSEATKRVALLAFVVDAYHSLMFGHPSLIAIHEIRLSLPCSQYLWDSFPAENQRLMPQTATLPLIEALKVTLNNKHVETSPFGRKVLLSGLLSIAYQMQQREIQLESLDWNNSGKGGQGQAGWKEHMYASFDFWLNDSRSMLLQSNAASFDHYPIPNSKPVLSSSSQDRVELLSPLEIVSGSPNSAIHNGAGLSYQKLHVSGCADPFYHLAQINLCISTLDLQIYGGVPLLFSRTLRTADFQRAQSAVQAWALGPEGSGAVRHAILFLEEIFCPQTSTDVCPNPFSLCPVVPGEYSADTDILIHRPRAVFLCTLVVWAYAFVLDGPESQALAHDAPVIEGEEGGGMAQGMDGETPARNAAQAASAALARASTIPPKKSGMQYISWLSAAVASPTPRSKMAIMEGCNETAGLLQLVIRALQTTHWAVVAEDARLLVHCLERTLGKPSTKCLYHI